jgi:hypothetical protein
MRQKVRGRTKAEVREKLQALHRELEAGLRVSATYTVASCIRDWLDDGLTTRRASTVENYRRLADHAIGKLGAVKLKDLTARQVQKALAELSASLSARSLRPPLLSTRLTRDRACAATVACNPRAGCGILRLPPERPMDGNRNLPIDDHPGLPQTLRHQAWPQRWPSASAMETALCALVTFRE